MIPASGPPPPRAPPRRRGPSRTGHTSSSNTIHITLTGNWEADKQNITVMSPYSGVSFGSVSDPNSGFFWIRIRFQGLKKRSKVFNHHKLILLLTTLHFQLTSLMRKSNN